MNHTWGYCAHCQEYMVVCGECGNNCCNGMYGKEGQCKSCPDAYDLQDREWKKRNIVSRNPDDVD